MKVLHLGCAYRPYLGGSTQRLAKLAESSAGVDGVRLYLATHTSSQDSSADNRPFERVFRGPSVNSMAPDPALLSWLREIEPDVVVIHNSRALAKWIAQFRWRFRRTRIVVEIHSFRDTSAASRIGNSLLYRFADHFVVLSSSSGARLRGQYKLDRITVVPNGLEARGALRDPRLYDPETATFAYVGSFHDWQGVEIAARSASALGQSYWQRRRLLLAGGGPSVERVIELLRPIANLPTVRYLGWQNDAEVGALLAQTDFLLAPRMRTVATETVIPLKVPESIGAGIPLVASTVGGLTEILQRPAGDLAFFVEPDTPLSLQRWMEQLPSAETYQAMCRRLAAARDLLPSWRSAGQTYVDLYRSLAA